MAKEMVFNNVKHVEMDEPKQSSKWDRHWHTCIRITGHDGSVTDIEIRGASAEVVEPGPFEEE